MFRAAARHRGRLAAAVALTAGAGYALNRSVNHPVHAQQSIHPSLAQSSKPYPTRDQALALSKSTVHPSALSQQSQQNQSNESNDDSNPQPIKQFDLLIIGGGATGAGIALDAATRGLSVVCVDQNDWSSGTSSRSTKLIHGGIRYLQKAFTQADIGQYNLVTEALSERSHMLAIAPHLTRELPIIVPVYGSMPSVLFWAPYYWIGCKMYDLVAGQGGLLKSSYWVSRSKAMKMFPNLKHDSLFGGVVYYDGQQNDSRMNVSLMLTALQEGAVALNHVKVNELLQHDGRVVGARVMDTDTFESWPIYAKQVINATGPYSDAIRKMADPSVEACITPSAGIHIVLPSRYTPDDMGLIVPETSDGRVIFMLPWEGAVVAGTTDYLSEITTLPKPGEEDVQFLLKEISLMLDKPIARSDVQAAWSGIRPLAKDTKAKDTQSVSRDHVIEHTAPGLISIAGGKWTTYRRMAQDVLDKVLKEHEEGSQQSTNQSNNQFINTSNLKPCSTWKRPLIGNAISDDTHSSLAHLPTPISDHLIHYYGDRAPLVASIATEDDHLSQRLAPNHPFIEAEVLYACRHEYATTVIDVIAHRTRIAFLDSQAATDVVPRVIQIMAKHYNWDQKRQALEVVEASNFIDTMNIRPEAK